MSTHLGVGSGKSSQGKRHREGVGEVARERGGKRTAGEGASCGKAGGKKELGELKEPARIPVWPESARREIPEDVLG